MGPLLPTVTRLLSQAPGTDHGGSRPRSSRCLMLASFTMATAIPGIYVAIPLLFGRHFGQAQSPFLILGLVSCLQSVSVPLAMLVFATRNAGSMLRINLICVVVDAALAIGLGAASRALGCRRCKCFRAIAERASDFVRCRESVGIEGSAVIRTCLPLILGFGAASVAVALAQLPHVPTGVLMVLAPLTGLIVVVVGYMCLPTWRVSSADAGLVEISLPSWLRSPFRWITRSFRVVAPVTAYPSEQ